MNEERPTVLVVDDEPLVRLTAVDLIAELGLEAVEASSADEALEILEVRRDIRVVVTDIDMPGSMDGIKLARYVRDRWPPIIVIAVTGKALAGASMMPEGVQIFAKPYDERALGQAILAQLYNSGIPGA
jgi:CheY-like chemotaxis protein